MPPAERRLVLARAEAACLSESTSAATTHASARKQCVKQISPWLRELMSRYDVTAPETHSPNMPTEEGGAMEIQ